jgi:Glycosyl transferases group 1
MKSVTPYVSGDNRVIPNGIDYARFAAPDIAPIEEFDDGRPNILFVGRLDERKGFQHLLSAYTYVKRVIPDSRLLVVGAFDKEAMARFLENDDGRELSDVHWIGRVSAQELPRYYRTATLFCAPSTGAESFGIVLLEAMAAGLPVIASDIPGYRSVMQDGAQGRFAPPADEMALAEAIRRLLLDPEGRSRMAACGRATASRYDWQVVAPRVLDYYEELMQARQQCTARPHALSWPGPATDRKVSLVSSAMNGLMQGLSLLEPKPAPGAFHETPLLVVSGPLPMRLNVSARVNDLFKVELGIRSLHGTMEVEQQA